MRSLSRIRRDIISFYSLIQNKITDFTSGSVINGIFYAVSAVLESFYTTLAEIRRQAYISTATGVYLDRLIESTFQLSRNPATRSSGYVTIYSESPLTEDITLFYADTDENGDFSSGLTNATKFTGYSGDTEEGIIYVLTKPSSPTTEINENENTITIPSGTQYSILPVSSFLTGSKVRVSEGEIYSFPSSPNGISGVLNTMNPGLIFSSNEEYTGGTPFSSRFTSLREYNDSTSTLRVDNAFNFSGSGLIELKEDIFGNPITAVYSNGFQTLEAGLVFEYIDSSLNTVTLKQPISKGVLPFFVAPDSQGNPSDYTLVSYTYTNSNSITVSFSATDENFFSDLISFIQDNSSVLVVHERRPSLVDELIFDPDNKLLADYTLSSDAAVSGASDESNDSEYRELLRSYLGSLGRSTKSSLVAGALQTPEVDYATVLPNYLSRPGSATVVASDQQGFLSREVKNRLKKVLDEEWKSAGVSLRVRSPNRIPVHVSLSIKTNNDETITEQIISLTDSYFRSLRPGNKISYSELLRNYNQIEDISNVFNLVITKKLTEETYDTNKASYDEQFLLDFVGGEIKQIQSFQSVPPAENSSLGDLIYNSSLDSYQVFYNGSWQTVNFDLSLHERSIMVLDVTEVNATIDFVNYEDFEDNIEDYQFLGVVYSSSNTGELFYQPENIELSYEILPQILDASKVSDLEVIFNTYKSRFVGTEEDFYYVASYILSETINPETLPDYPVNPSEVKAENIQDYEAGPIDIFKLDSFIFQNASSF